MTINPTIRQGDSGADVKALQLKLGVVVDGRFGPLTREALEDFQRRHGLTPDGIAGPQTWAALQGSPVPVRRDIKEIIIHYTATPQGEEFSNAQITASHLARGFSSIGYHYVIGLGGEIRPGRPEAIIGAHCTGHNAHSLGVCYVGGCPPRSTPGWKNIGLDTRTSAQKRALLSLLRDLKKRYPKATIHGHREFAAKPCPGFDARAEYKNV